MNTYAIKDFELDTTITANAQGVAEVMFDYLPWPTFDGVITFSVSDGWTVIDNRTDFKYEVTAIQRLVMLPCPFCGEDDDLYAHDYAPCWCGKCGASAGSIGKLKKDQVDIWNERAT